MNAERDFKKQAEEHLGKMRRLKNKNKAQSKEIDQLTKKRDELAHDMASKNTQLSIKDDEITVKREKIDKQSLELAAMRLKSKKIGALLR